MRMVGIFISVCPPDARIRDRPLLQGNMDEAEANFRRCCKIQRRLGEYDRHLREDGHDTIPTTVYADAISNLARFLRSRADTVSAVVLNESTSRITP